MVFVDHRIPVVLHDASVLAAVFIPRSIRLAFEGSFQDGTHWNSHERGIRP